MDIVIADVPLVRVIQVFILIVGAIGSLFIIRLHITWIKNLITFRWFREKNIYLLTPYGAAFDIEYDPQTFALRMTCFCLALYIEALAWALYAVAPSVEPVAIWLVIFGGLLAFGVFLSLFFKNPSYRGLIFND